MNTKAASDTGRVLATLETVSAITAIDGADSIEAAKVRGWTVVVQKGEYQVGDRCIYIEADAFLPFTIDAYKFLASRSTKTVDGVDGHVLTTARLRGCVSQGLLLRPETFDVGDNVNIGDDVGGLCGVSLYEAPIPAELADSVAGPFPRVAPKTGSARVQNLGDVWETLRQGDWQATEKIDGESMTVICDTDGAIRVCGRNWEFAPGNNSMQEMAAAHIGAHIEPGWYVQGEVFGAGVHPNTLKLTDKRLAVFAVGRNGARVPRNEWPQWVKALSAPELDLQFPATADEALTQAQDLMSTINPARRAEGIVWHERTGRQFAELGKFDSIKAISNTYLLKQNR